MPIVTIRDEVLGRGAVQEFDLEVLTEHVTVRELIRSRVYEEVQDHNVAQVGGRRLLIEPQEAERVRRAPAVARRRPVDWRVQFDLAIEAFGRGQILVLVGDRQCTQLDEEVQVGTATKVTFVRLVPLVGG
jgi:hypothetical protein